MKGIAATARKRAITLLCYINGLCGVAGFTKLKFSPGPERIRSAVQSIVHRGPDQQGVFETDTVSLAATRLKIIDLSFRCPAPFLGEPRYRHSFQRRNLQLRGVAAGTGTARPPLPIAKRYGSGPGVVPGMGCGLFRALSRHVRPGAVDGIARPAGAGTRPHGHQAAVYRAARRRSVLRLGAEIDFRASRNSTGA